MMHVKIYEDVLGVKKLLPSDCLMSAQWLSGWVLDSRPRGRGFKPHQRHCVVVLEQSKGAKTHL